MITTVAASVALATAVPTLDNSQARLCNSDTASNPLCCATDIVGVVNLDCSPREFSPRLGIKGTRLSALLYRQPLPYLMIFPTSTKFVPPPASELGAASFHSYVIFIL